MTALLSDEERTTGREQFLMSFCNLFTDAEFAKAIGVTEQTLTEWRCKKIGPAYVKLGRNVFYHLHDVNKWIQTRRVQTSESANEEAKAQA